MIDCVLVLKMKVKVAEDDIRNGDIRCRPQTSSSSICALALAVSEISTSEIVDVEM